CSITSAWPIAVEWIVCKRKDAAYRSGTRSGWIKVKCEVWKLANKDRRKLFEKDEKKAALELVPRPSPSAANGRALTVSQSGCPSWMRAGSNHDSIALSERANGVIPDLGDLMMNFSLYADVGLGRPGRPAYLGLRARGPRGMATYFGAFSLSVSRR